jgi:hypothetical protein
MHVDEEDSGFEPRRWMRCIMVVDLAEIKIDMPGTVLKSETSKSSPLG